MSGRKPALLCVAALLAGALAMSAPAAAQCRLCAEPETQIPGSTANSAIRLEVQALLDFDQIVLMDSSGSGTARINPDGSQSTSGSLAQLSGRAMVGSVVIRGEPGKAVQVELPREILLYGIRGGTLRLGAITSDLASEPRLDSQGELRFRFGGELSVSGDVEGDYRGDVPLTVDYL